MPTLRPSLPVLIFASCLLATLNVRAQAIDAATFFARPYATPQAPQAAAPPFRAPWLENTEVRTETRRFDPDRQRYTLRLSPSAPGLRRAQRALATQLDARPDFDAAEDRCDAVRRRHEDWLRLYLIDAETDLLRSLDTVLADRRTVLERTSASLDFDWNALVSLTTDRGDLAQRRLRLDQRRRYLLLRNGLPPAELDFTDFPVIGELPALETSGETLVKEPKNRRTQELTYDRELASRELEVERAEGRQYLDFFQAEYTGPHTDPLGERVSLGLAFQLPSGGNRKLKMRELALELDRLDREAARATAAHAVRQTTRAQRYAAARAVYAELAELLMRENAELTDIGRRISQRDGFDPLPLLALRARTIRNRLALLNERGAVLEAYLEAVDPTELCARGDGSVLVR